MDDTKSISIEKEEFAQDTEPKPDLSGYKSVCAKLGLSMCIYFILRLLTGLVAPLLRNAPAHLSPSLLGFLYYIIVVLMAYVIPLAATVLIFKYRPHLPTLYKKPRRVARALGVFPATIGLGYGVALLTLLTSFILSRIFGGETYIEQLLQPTNLEPSRNMTELLMSVFMLVVIAPVFEEYWVRGIMFDALQPYGTGMAIIISSLLFGLMHGSLYMLFYTTAFGLALGYIRYATGSLFIATILHAIVNSLSATMLFLQSLVNLTNGEYKAVNTIEMIFTVSVLILIIVGIVVFLTKIPTIRKYKFENKWTQLGSLRKLGTFLISVPVLIMFVLAFNELSGFLLFDLIFPR